MYWSVENSEDSLFPAEAWGIRFGVVQRRSETVLRYMTVHDPTTSNRGNTARWHPVRTLRRYGRCPPVCTLVNAFNQCRHDTIRPLSCFVVNESFASWISRKPDHTMDALPHTKEMIS